MSDTPDFGITGYSKETRDGAVHLDADLSDVLAELQTLNVHQANIEAATILSGHPLRYQSGSMLFLENWEHGNGFWQSSSHGTGAGSALSTVQWYSVGQSWKLTAGSDGARYAEVHAEIGRYKAATVGVYYVANIDSQIDFFDLRLQYCYDSTLCRAYLRVDTVDDELSIYNEDQGLTVVKSGLKMDVAEEIFHYFKLVVDMDNKLYQTAYVDDDEIDLSAYAVYSHALATDDPLKIQFYLSGPVGNKPYVYLDDIALTEED